jgi:hypothetical protein
MFTEVEELLYWDAPDFPKLGAFVQSTLLDFIGDEYHFQASFKWNGHPATRKRYDSLNEWETSLSASPDELSIDLYSSKTNRHVSLWLYSSDQRGNITIKVPDEDLEEATGVIKKMSQTLPLSSTKNDAIEKNVELVRTYQTNQAIGQEWFSSFITFLETLVEGITHASCTYQMSVPPSYKYTSNQIDKWRSGVLENWNKISQATCDLDTLRESIRIDWDLDTGEFRLSARSYKEERVNSLIDALEKQAGLPVLIGNPYRQRLQGEQNFYFTSSPMNFEWLDRSVKEFFKYIGNEINHSDFSVRKIAEQPKPVNWQDKEPWLEFIHENWASILQAHCFITSNKLSINFDCEPLHDWVSLIIQAPTQSRVVEIAQDLQEKLGLQQIEGRSYGSVRSSGYYSVGNWSNQGFANAVEQSVSQFSKFSLESAGVIEEKGEAERDHKNFDDVATFLHRLAKGKRYLEAHLRIKGPQGAQMGIHITDKCRKLELKSHLPPDKFPELVKLFDDELDLKKIAETKEQAESQSKSLKDSIWVLILLPLVTSVLTSTILSEQFRVAAIPKYSLQVVTPSSEDGKPIVLTTRQFQVYWRLQTERWFKKKVDLDSPVSYRLFGNGVLIKHEENVRPGAMLNLPPGTYQMEITSVPSGEQSYLTFTISSTESNSKQTQ